MKTIPLPLIGSLLLITPMVDAQLIRIGDQTHTISAASFSQSLAGVVVMVTITPAPSDTAKLNLVVFAPSADVSLPQLNVAGGRYAFTMDEAGDYFNFDLKADNGTGKDIGPLIIHELRKQEQSKGSLRLALRHKLSVRGNERFPTSGRLEIALATEGKGPKGEPQFTIVSNSLVGTAK